MTNGETTKKWSRSKKKLRGIKEYLLKYGKRAEKYIENPSPKALAMTAAAGALIGTFWSAFKAKKPSSPKRKTNSTPDV